MKREELLQVAKPILFNTDMVRAILDGRKMVTRRVIKPQPKMILCYAFAGYGYGKWYYPDKDACKYWGDKYKRNAELTPEDDKRLWTPPYHTDDILYVRETWTRFDCCSCEGDYRGNCSKEQDKKGGCYMYRSSDEIWGDTKWHPSIHMPKEAARIFLKVTKVRVERLQDMPHDGPLKEGIHYCECPDGFTWKSNTDMHNCYTSPMGAMKSLWDSTIKKSDLDSYGWEANPWVWMIEFERVVEE